jgi:hypothetical protein
MRRTHQPRVLTAFEAARPIPHIPQVRKTSAANRWVSRTPRAKPVRKYVDESLKWTDEERAEAMKTAEKPPAFLTIGRQAEAEPERI